MFFQSMITGGKKGIETTWMLAKIVIPVYFFVTFLKYSGVLQYISRLFQPLMQLFGLPGEASIVLVLGNGLNLYAAIGAMKAMTLTPWQITVLSIMLSFSHSLFMETAVVKSLHISGFKIALMRIGLMIGAGLITGGILGRMVSL